MIPMIQAVEFDFVSAGAAGSAGLLAGSDAGALAGSSVLGAATVVPGAISPGALTATGLWSPQ